MKKIISILIMGFLVLSIPVTVNANSALKFWEGTSATGTFSSDEDCPLIVEHEDLYFEIPDLPPACPPRPPRATGRRPRCPGTCPLPRASGLPGAGPSAHIPPA